MPLQRSGSEDSDQTIRPSTAINTEVADPDAPIIAPPQSKYYRIDPPKGQCLIDRAMLDRLPNIELVLAEGPQLYAPDRVLAARSLPKRDATVEQGDSAPNVFLATDSVSSSTDDNSIVLTENFENVGEEEGRFVEALETLRSRDLHSVGLRTDGPHGSDIASSSTHAIITEHIEYAEPGKRQGVDSERTLPETSTRARESQFNMQLSGACSADEQDDANATLNDREHDHEHEQDADNSLARPSDIPTLVLPLPIDPTQPREDMADRSSKFDDELLYANRTLVSLRPNRYSHRTYRRRLSRPPKAQTPRAVEPNHRGTPIWGDTGCWTLRKTRH